MRTPSRRSRIVYRGALAASLVAVVLSAGAARAGTTQFARIGADAAIEAENVPTLPDLTALKSNAETEALKWATSNQLMREMFKQRAKASKTTPDRLMLYLARQATLSVPGLNLQFSTLQMIGGQMSNYIGIRVDTPDPSYAQITPLAARRILTSDNLDGAEPAFARYATSLSAETTLVQAFLKSLERYQGADADGNGAWALVHARAIRDYAISLASQLDQTVASMQLMRFVFDSDPRPIDAQIAELKEWRNRVAADGAFSVAERREAANLGIGPNQLAGMKENLLQDDWNLSRASVVAHMDELVATHAALKPILLALATDMAPLVAQLEADPLVPDLGPVANAGGPYTGAQNAPISFNASASTSPSAITAYDWDLDGDGAFDDAAGANPTRDFSTTRNTTVGVQVTNADGQVDVAYARLEVTPASGGGSGLILNDFSPFRVGSQFIGEASVRLGETQVFSVTVGNANHYIWQLDDLFTGTSGVPSYSLTPATVQIGAHSVKVIVTSASNGSLSINWDVSVLAPDGDGDLWNANADCDDADAAVHPLRAEIAGNGKDDDCDPATPDASTTAPPVASDVSLTTAEDTPIGVTLAGTDADGNPLAGGPTSDPAHGGFVDGVYSPDPNFNGTDSFTFAVVDSHGGTDSGTVTITVTAVDDSPEWEIAPPSQVTIRPNGLLAFDVIGRDVDGSDIVFSAVTTGCVNPPADKFGPNFFFDTEFFPSQGTVIDAGVPRRESTTLTIHAKPGAAHGTYCLKLLLMGEHVPSVVQELSIVVTDGIPVAASDSYVTDEDVTLNRAAPGVLANDTDPEGESLTAQLVAPPAHGTANLAPDGSFQYTPVPNFNGPDEFTYRVLDGSGNASQPATVALTVRPVNDAPRWETILEPQTVQPDSTLTVDLIGLDLEGDDLHFFTGTNACVNPAIIGGPVFHSDTGLSPFEGVVVDAGTPRRERVTLTIHTKPGAAAGTYCLRLFVGENEGERRLGLGSVDIVIPNNPPVGRMDAASTDEDVTLTAVAPGVLMNDEDPNGEPLTAEFVTGPAHGALTLAPNGSFVYVPAPNFNGTDGFSYRAIDASGNASETVTASLTVRPVNDAPAVVDRSVTTAQGTPVAIALTGTDVDGDSLTFTHSSPFHGTYDGATYTPATGYSGPDLFTYTASDGHGGSATAVVSITVTPVNPPTDTTPPSCEIVEQGKTAAGNPFIRFRVTETGVGLARHEPGYLLNTSVLVEPYAVGSLGPVTVTATAINKKKSMAVEVFFYDLAGNRALCDPIVMSVQRLVGKPQDEVLRNVPGTDHRITVTNGAPGMSKIVLFVNGKYFGQHRLKSGQVRKFSVGTAMRPGYVNTIRVRASGPTGAKATVVIANIP